MKNGDSLTTSTTRKRRRLAWLLVGCGIVLVALIGGTLVWRYFFAHVQTREIYAVLEQRAQALEQKDLDRYMACFSTTYQSPSQAYENLRVNASRWFEQFATIEFSFHVLDIQELDGEHVIVENQYKFSLTNADGEPVDIAQRELLEMQRERREWKITKSLSLH